jgi:hypothetical protein
MPLVMGRCGLAIPTVQVSAVVRESPWFSGLTGDGLATEGLPNMATAGAGRRAERSGGESRLTRCYSRLRGGQRARVLVYELMTRATRAGLIIARTMALVVHIAVGIAIFLSIIGVHPWIVGLGLIAWIVGIILIHEWWSSHPIRVLGLPIVLAAAYFLAVVIGNEFGLVGA